MRRFIICTPLTSGRLENRNQHYAPERAAQRSARGQVRGESQKNKLNLLGINNKVTSTAKSFSICLIWIGILAFAFLATGISGSKKAQAADRSWGNLEIAKTAIANVAPVVSESEVDHAAASFVFADEYIQKPLVTETVETKEEPKRVVAQRRNAPPKPKTQPAVRPVAQFGATGGHRFPYGYCTYYVSQRRTIPWGGNAITWLSGARSFGFATGSTPQVGAVVVTSEGGRAGHVAVVDAVNGGQITLSEMNYKGFGIVSSRTISASSGYILGYIY